MRLTSIQTAVKALEAYTNHLEDLAGEVIATLIVNRDRGHFSAMPHAEEWLKIIAKFEERYKAIVDALGPSPEQVYDAARQGATARRNKNGDVVYERDEL